MTSELYRVCNSAAHQLGWYNELEFLNNDDSELDEEQEKSPLIKALSSEEQMVAIPPFVVYRIDRSILFSKQLDTERRNLENQSGQLDEVAEMIMIKKGFAGSKKSPVGRVLCSSLSRISETYSLTIQINERASTKYDSTNPIHEQKLLKLWNALMPETELESRLTRQWAEIGFQGNDPATDFRGMGLQGLDDLIYYATTHTDSAQRTFSSSRHPVSWYPFAIVGINITQCAVQALRTRQLQYYLYKYGANKKTYSEFYCYLYHKFNDFWISHQEPKLTVMDFEMKFKEFKIQMNKELTTHQTMPLVEWLEKKRIEQQNLEKENRKVIEEEEEEEEEEKNNI
ncbi:hypothetical protein INT45_011484, partial [Circinella minor]